MKNRNAALAALLNVAGPGLGFLYLGRRRWALGTLVAQAKTNENHLTDEQNRTQYEAGMLQGTDYLKYINDRIASEPNSTASRTTSPRSWNRPTPPRCPAAPGGSWPRILAYVSLMR